MEVVRQSHTVPKIGTVCNYFHIACCVNHTRLALANRCLRNSVWDRKPSPPSSKKKKKTLTIPTSQKPSPRPPPPPVPINTRISSSASMHGPAYRGDNHLARCL